MTSSTRWWGVSTVAGTALACVLVLLDRGAGGRPWVAVALLAVLPVVHLAWGHRAMLHEGTTASRGYGVVIIALSGAACIASPTAAMIQVIAYPLLWYLSTGFRTGAVRSLALGAAVVVGTGLGPAGWGSGVITGMASAAFSVAMGAWFMSVYRYADERAALVEKLQRAQEASAALERAAATTDERARVARELHDTVTQSLTGLVMAVQRTQRSLAEEPGRAARDLEVVADLARSALAESRTLVAGYAATSDLRDSLRRVASAFERETGIDVVLALDDCPLAREHEVVVLRTVQEALANVRKHSRASHAWIALRSSGDGVQVEVADDGVGPGRAVPLTGPARRDPGGYGLAGLHARLQLVGGWVTFGARQPRGSVLRAFLPADDRSEASA